MFFYLPKLDVPLLNFFNFQYANYMYLIGKIYYVTGHIQLATHNFDTCCFRYFYGIIDYRTSKQTYSVHNLFCNSKPLLRSVNFEE